MEILQKRIKALKNRERNRMKEREREKEGRLGETQRERKSRDYIHLTNSTF